MYVKCKSARHLLREREGTCAQQDGRRRRRQLIDRDCALAKGHAFKCPSGWAAARERLKGAGEYLDPADKQKKSQYGLWDGDALLSHRVAPAVPSARVGLTSGFGMGPGVPPQQESPAHKKHWLSWTSFALSAEDKKELCAHNHEEASTIFRIMGASHVKHNYDLT